MAYQTALVIAVPMVIEALSTLLNIKKEKLQEYYDTSQAFRDYLNSLTNGLNVDVHNELANVTPTTTPRFDIPWITDELKKKQNDLFNIKQQITKVQTEAHQAAQETWEQSPEKNNNNWFEHLIGGKDLKDAFYTRKKIEADKYTKKTGQLIGEGLKITKRPLKNNNPTYQTIQERKRNAQISEKK